MSERVGCVVRKECVGAGAVGRAACGYLRLEKSGIVPRYLKRSRLGFGAGTSNPPVSVSGPGQRQRIGAKGSVIRLSNHMCSNLMNGWGLKPTKAANRRGSSRLSSGARACVLGHGEGPILVHRRITPTRSTARYSFKVCAIHVCALFHLRKGLLTRTTRTHIIYAVMISPVVMTFPNSRYEEETAHRKQRTPEARSSALIPCQSLREGSEAPLGPACKGN